MKLYRVEVAVFVMAYNESDALEVAEDVASCGYPWMARAVQSHRDVPPQALEHVALGDETMTPMWRRVHSPEDATSEEDG